MADGSTVSPRRCQQANSQGTAHESILPAYTSPIAQRLYFCTFGDGTANRGTFHEALNLAAIWDLPVVFICENNYFAELSKISDFIRVESIADRAVAYGIPGYAVDGHDPVAIAAAITRAQRTCPGRC